MRKVIDSNFLKRDELRSYLSRSPKNEAVLTDYASMEAYKGNTLVSIFESMSILADFPRQVMILKPTILVCGLRGRAAGLQRRMIDEAQSLQFREYCRDLQRAELGDHSLEQQLLDLGRAADEQMARILTDAMKMPDVIDELAKRFTDNELKIIRTRSRYTHELIGKLLNSVVELARLLFERHPHAVVVKNIDELPNTFLFRYALCAMLWALEWIAVGGAGNVTRFDRLRNDIVDTNFATFATYFDGFMTADEKPRIIYERAKVALEEILVAARNRPLNYSSAPFL